MQEMHLSLSIFDGSLKSMACIGHSVAQTLQFTHFFVGFGTKPLSFDILYGRFPGICGFDISFSSSFFLIAFVKAINWSLSCVSGLPLAYCLTIECSAIAEIAATVLNPA